ncbi:hypothetical protein HF888_07150 [Bermanella marisrubri]|uniref:Uncharacterized protein n=1 Tax=Bermanella marisrubri TaxID=207949 RepID=Q1N527_9GAMM|nr:hypothetical protein [Bermanella marisrubri]EAT13251.1 hypothetical protein RED65_00785 [Oceanobacter sp. RED65] [Bermanella marisrubri]QIZ84019.1 hypothetical protein HF888_07150 [Bermanella marisrubri]
MIESKKDTLLNDIVGSLILFIVIGFPFWLPVVLIVKDIWSDSGGGLIGLLQESSIQIDLIAKKVLEYALPFLPGVILIFLWRSTKLEEELSGDFTTLDCNAIPDSIDSSPIAITGKPKNNVEWVRLSDEQYRLTKTVRYKMLTRPIMLVGLLVWLVFSLSTYSDRGTLALLNNGIWVLLLGATLELIFKAMISAGPVIDIGSKKIVYGKLIFDFDDVHALQILTKNQTYNEAGGELYVVYECNLVLTDGKRLNLLNHGESRKLIEQIDLITKQLNCDVIADKAILAVGS